MRGRGSGRRHTLIVVNVLSVFFGVAGDAVASEGFSTYASATSASGLTVSS